MECKNNNCMISVIVPVYNTEKYLDRCVESILNQTYTDFELILVDDGSQDNCPEICDYWEKKDSRVKVIYQKNKGVSEARNSGLSAASGEKIVFVDSDDFIADNFFKLCSETKSDLLIFGYYIGNQKKICNEKRFKHLFFQTNNMRDMQHNFENGQFNYCWSKCFSNKIIKDNHIDFCENLSLGEDTCFVLDYLKYCNDVELSDYCGYYYIHREDSLSTEMISTKMIDTIENLNLKIRKKLGKLFDNVNESMIIHCGVLYVSIVSDIVNNPSKYNYRFVKFLFKQKEFKNCLNHADEVFSKESKSFKKLLKSKSSIVFFVFIKINQMKNR